MKRRFCEEQTTEILREHEAGVSAEEIRTRTTWRITAVALPLLLVQRLFVLRRKIYFFDVTYFANLADRGLRYARPRQTKIKDYRTKRLLANGMVLPMLFFASSSRSRKKGLDFQACKFAFFGSL